MSHRFVRPFLFTVASAALVSVADSGSAPEAAFAAPFSSHAVLQRDCPLPVWGTAAPGTAVSVSLDGQSQSATADAAGRWQVVFLPQTEPGLGHTLALSANGTPVATLDDIAIGDVWLCSGQSNMDMNYGWGLTRGKEDIETTNDPMMRIFDDKNAASIEPLDALTKPAAWTASDFSHSRSFSACGWFFGQALRKALPDVPIGLVEASWSGSPLKTWLSAESYRAAGPDCAAEYDQALKAHRDYELSGGQAEYEKRLALWQAETDAKGDIHAEDAGYDDSTWKAVSLPVSFEKQFDAGFDGCVWYRRAVELTAAQAASEATLSLGPIDDKDITWINGERVGSTAAYDEPRLYKIPAGVLREGRNVIAVQSFDYRGNGGFTGRPDQLFLAVGGEKVALAGEWRSVGFAYDPKPKSGAVDCWMPTACYNAMLHPLFPMALKGAIWYQGCSDVGQAERYGRVFRKMAADWRAHFTHPDGMPIYLVQLAAFRLTNDQPFDSPWARMRWEHMRLGETLEKSGAAVAIDIGHHTDIHPKDKKTVGERLARLALVRTYGVPGLVEAGPIPQSAVLADGKVSVTFKDAAGLSTSDGASVAGFQLVDALDRAVWAEAALDGETAVVSVPGDFTPTKVRYAWDDYPECNLVNGDGLPCGPFELRVTRQ